MRTMTRQYFFFIWGKAPTESSRPLVGIEAETSPSASTALPKEAYVLSTGQARLRKKGGSPPTICVTLRVIILSGIGISVPCLFQVFIH